VAGYGTEARAPQLLVDHRHPDRPQSLPATLLGHLRAPEPASLCLLADLGQEILADMLALAERARVLLERQKHPVHEGGGALAELIKLRRETKIHGRRLVSAVRAGRSLAQCGCPGKGEDDASWQAGHRQHPSARLACPGVAWAAATATLAEPCERMETG
jgi:hypothetical protein